MRDQEKNRKCNVFDILGGLKFKKCNISPYICNVKFFAFIMAFLVLWLSCLPCGDDAFAINTSKQKAETVKKNTSQEEQNHTDACSPFCQCACCPGFSVNHTLTPISILPIICTKQFSCYLSPTTVNISLPIWQPPQLVS